MSRRELVTAGATIRHESPFSALPVPPPPDDEIAIPEWQRRALRLGLFQPGTITALRRGDIMSVDVDFARELLTVFNWRHRMLGAYLAAIKDFQPLESLIGTLLLRSDVCYAGQAYCLALVRSYAGSESAVTRLAERVDDYTKMLAAVNASLPSAPSA
jgi:hypothetical protein